MTCKWLCQWIQFLVEWYCTLGSAVYGSWKVKSSATIYSLRHAVNRSPNQFRSIPNFDRRRRDATWMTCEEILWTGHVLVNCVQPFAILHGRETDKRLLLVWPKHFVLHNNFVQNICRTRRRKNLILSLPPNMRTLVTPTYEFLVYIRQTTAVTTTVNHPPRAREWYGEWRRQGRDLVNPFSTAAAGKWIAKSLFVHYSITFSSAFSCSVTNWFLRTFNKLSC